MNKPPYICFEGLDGSGKSTIVKRIVPLLEQQGYKVQSVCPTKAGCQCRGIETIFHRFPCLHRYRFLRMFLYAHRSNYAADHMDRNADLLLGDRSLVTSYICRWTRSPLRNRFVVFLVDRLEYKIPAPDHIIYLDVPHQVLCQRLSGRGMRDIDETEKRSREMRQAYDMLRSQKAVVRRLRGATWHSINGDQQEEAVCRDALGIIMPLLKKTELRKEDTKCLPRSH